MAFDIQIDLRQDVARVALSGELDLATAPELHDQLVRLLEAARNTVIDLRGLSFIDSSGLEVFIRHYQRCQEQGAEMHLLVSDEGPPRVFQLAGLDTVLPLTRSSEWDESLG